MGTATSLPMCPFSPPPWADLTSPWVWAGFFLPPSSAPIPPTDLEESWQSLGVGGGRGTGKLDSQLIPPREVESEESCLKV